MGSLNLPPIPRKKNTKAFDAQSSWSKDLPNGWHFSPKDVARFKSMGLNQGAVREIVEAIGQPVRYNLSDYLYSARLAGVEPQAFLEIAQAGVLESPPSLTVLRQYLGACNQDPLLAMLAYRAKLSPQELTDLQEDGELNVKNLRAMIDLS